MNNFSEEELMKLSKEELVRLYLKTRKALANLQTRYDHLEEENEKLFDLDELIASIPENDEF